MDSHPDHLDSLTLTAEVPVEAVETAQLEDGVERFPFNLTKKRKTHSREEIL